MAIDLTIGHARAEGQSRPLRGRLGLWLFLASESFLFGALISARYILSGTEKPEHLNQPLALGVTVVLLLSSVSAYLAETSIAYGDRKRLLRYTTATIVLGILFMVGVVFEWREASEFFPASTLYGSSFFTLIGLHAFHVLSGVVALLIVLNLARKGRFGPEDYWGVEGSIKYWHFVDLAWVVIYPTLYLF